MPDQLQLRGGTTVQHSTFTGASKEVTVDTTKKTVVVHDGSTAGGNPIMREDGSNSALVLGSAGTPSLKFTGDTNTGIYSPGADQVAIATGGTERLRIDNTGQIQAVSLGTAAAPTWSFTGDPNTGIYSPGADQVAISTNGTGRLFVDASGNVLLNDSASVTSNVSAYLRIRQVNAAADTSIGIINAQNSDANATVKIKAGQATRNGGEIVFGRENGGDWSTTNLADGYIAFSPVLNNANTEALRIDSSGRLLVGTSSYFDNGISADSQLLIANTTVGHIATTTWSASNNGAYLTLGRSRGTSIGSNTAVAENDELGVLAFAGDNGSSLVNRAAQIAAYVDGEVGTAGDTTDMPGRLVFSTSADGASSPTEQWRLTNDGVQALRQATPAAVDTTATLTVAQLKGRIITSSTAAAVTMTLPSGTDTEAGFSGIYTNMAFEWYVINTGATNAVTVQAGTAHTLVGSGSVAANTSGHFMSRRTAANTFVTYRLG